MLKVQQYLHEKGLSSLVEEFGIKTNEHEDGRVILNYHQIDSDKFKFEEIVRECRGLVLNKYDWSLVARSFPRFFNLGEYRKEQDKFRWGQSIATEKVDGSLIIIYYWNGGWHVNTRNSYSNTNVNDSPFTFRQLVDMALPQNWQNKFDPKITYIGEVCSLYNKVVRNYQTPTFYLLTSFSNEVELTHSATDDIAKEAGLLLPNKYIFSNVCDIQSFLTEKASKDPTYEGLVLRDKDNKRIKCKSESYIQLHRLSNNGNIASVKNILGFVLKGEESEILTYFPELKQSVYEVKNAIRPVVDRMMWLWNTYKDEPDQKRFALSIKDHPLSYALFKARKHNISPVDVLSECEEIVYNKLFKNS